MDEKKELEKNSESTLTPIEIVPDIEIPTLRTYKSDINQTVNKDKITTAKILIAEQKRKELVQDEKEQVSVKRPLNFVALFFGVLFVVAAIGIFGYFEYSKIVKKTFDAITIPPSFLFVFDDEKYIDASGSTLDTISLVDKNMKEVSNMKDETYTDLVFYKTNPSTKEKIRITSAEFFEIYGVKLPTNIARSTSKDFVYGVYKTNGKTEPFLVVGLVDFENAFDSMFIWENTLALDIKDVFPVLKNLFDISKGSTVITPSVTATSTASTTMSASTTSSISTSTSIISTTTEQVGNFTPEQIVENQTEMVQVINRTIRFVDIVLYNRGVRGVRDSNGNPFFYYSFIDRDKILFAQDPKIVNEINRKIKEKQLVR